MTASNSTVSSYVENGQCKLRICAKPESKEGTAPARISNLGHNQQFGSMVDLNENKQSDYQDAMKDIKETTQYREQMNFKRQESATKYVRPV